MKIQILNFKSRASLNGFTLIELLVVISIIGILLAVSVFGLMGARQASRDAKRKADLESIRSGLEIYKADCDGYPTSLGTSLLGSPPPTTCSSSNTYIASVPKDPMDPAQTYAYSNPTTSTYVLCALLERAPSPVMDTTGCGSCTAAACNYKVTNP